jgi:DNA-binding LytR/AlgR family response regulator
MSRLDPAVFLRVHRSHAVNIGAVRELRPMLHREYLIILGNGNGTAITSGRSYRAAIQDAFGLGRSP